MNEQYLYKQELYNTMGRDDELVDTVKLHLREKIIKKLQANQPKKEVPVDEGLMKKLCASLFLDYLAANRYLHTLSVFAPQSGSSRSQFSNEQLNSFFRISNEGCNSMLEAVLKQVLPKGRLTERRTESGVQTDDRECIQNLQSKLSNIEFEYKQKMALGVKSVQDSEQRFLKYKNQLNKRYKEELEAEINRVRDFQIANIRMDEQQKFKIRIKEYEEQLEQAHRRRLQKLREREADVMKRVATKMKDIEKYSHTMRQQILKDMESVKAREQELDRVKKALQVRQLNVIGSK